MIRIDAIWLATEPLDMRAGTETATGQGGGGLLFANKRANRMKVLVHERLRELGLALRREVHRQAQELR